ncbi:5'/3'-nucleotidase SurE [Roseospirillum parvum]|uniref:5'/3'-nucleotidase SurE n=1 Tax=Roseospirillum parvum TaxID=83401 RepID=UPI000B864713|nr:5'/3'-nucleotidase SurE [Roseospirillum parvum]
MLPPLADLSRARILVTNDDGINAPGLALLTRLAESLSDDVWVVAPETEQSGTGHSLSLHDPLRFREIEPRRFAVAGTPTDCVLLAVHKLIEGRRPDLVLSGVNRGANLGDDITYSGTVAAAMEGTLLGVRSIALSQIFRYPEPPPFETAEAHGPDLVRRLCAQSWPRNVLVNVNFPNCPPEAVSGLKVTRQGRRKIGEGITERTDPRGRPYVWIGPQRSGERHGDDSDLGVIGRGMISVTPLCVDLTHRATLGRLAEVLDDPAPEAPPGAKP